MDILKELDERLQSVEREREELKKQMKRYSRLASESQVKINELNGREKMLKDLVATIKSQTQ